jgi:hypothetical protein
MTQTSFFEQKSGRHNKFGTAIKGARLGYHWIPGDAALMRMGWREGDTIFVELIPFSPEYHEYLQKDGFDHIIWWMEGEEHVDGTKLFLMSPALRPLLFLKHLKRPVSFYINGDTGEFLK